MTDSEFNKFSRKYLKIPIICVYITFLFERAKNIFFHAYYLHAFVYIFVIEFHIANIFAILIVLCMILGSNARTILHSEDEISSDILQLFVTITHI